MSSFDYLKQIVEQRARIDRNQVIDEEFAFLSIKVAGEPMCLPADMVREIIPKPMVAAMGHAKPWYKGLMKVQGDIFSAVDIGLFLGKKSRGTRLAYAVALKSNSGQHAFLVEEVNGLVKEKVVKKQKDDFVNLLFTASGTELKTIIVDEIVDSPEFNNVSVFG